MGHYWTLLDTILIKACKHSILDTSLRFKTILCQIQKKIMRKKSIRLFLVFSLAFAGFTTQSAVLPCYNDIQYKWPKWGGFSVNRCLDCLPVYHVKRAFGSSTCGSGSNQDGPIPTGGG